jgi:predicted acyl esterase
VEFMSQTELADHRPIEPAQIVAIIVGDGIIPQAALFLPKQTGRWRAHTHLRPLEASAMTTIEVAVMPTAYRLTKGGRVQIDLVNCDSALTEHGWLQHEYARNRLGHDTIRHSRQYPSQIVLPVAK